MKLAFQLTAGLARRTLRAEWRRYRVGICRLLAEYRHVYTNYEDLLREGYDRTEAKEMATDTQDIPDTWEEYFRVYEFPFPIVARHLATFLKDPKRCHPKWLCKAVCAVASEETNPNTYARGNFIDPKLALGMD